MKMEESAIGDELIEALGLDTNSETIANIQFEEKNEKIKIKNLVPYTTNLFLKKVLQKSLLSNLSNVMNAKQEKAKLLKELHEKSKITKAGEEKFKIELNKVIKEIILEEIYEKLNSGTLSSAICPTSIEMDEIPNYYISIPRETYSRKLKEEVLQKMIKALPASCGKRTYGLYIPEKSLLFEIKRDVFQSLEKVLVAPYGANQRNIRAFEYTFYLLDRLFYRVFEIKIAGMEDNIQCELWECETTRGNKVFYRWYLVPDVEQLFLKLYSSDEKYIDLNGRKVSKIKSFIESFIEKGIESSKKYNSTADKIHDNLNLFLRDLLFSKTLNLDSILRLIEIKISFIPKIQQKKIYFLDEVIYTMTENYSIKEAEKWIWKLAETLKRENKENWLKRLLNDVRSAMLPYELSQTIAESCTKYHTSGINVGEIPKELKYFSTISEFKTIKALTLATLYNSLVSK